jgi:hypothetical protein
MLENDFFILPLPAILASIPKSVFEKNYFFESTNYLSQFHPRCGWIFSDYSIQYENDPYRGIQNARSDSAR